MKKDKFVKKLKRCWEFFHCPSQQYEKCLLHELDDWRCWTINIACCKINKDAPRPLSIKHVVCKNCEYFKEYKDMPVFQ